jgi:mRNA interferase RelE/StbE
VTDSYSLSLAKSAERELRELPKADRRRIVQRIKELAKTPRPAGSQKLSGQECYRVRQGDYRIVYAVDDAGRTVNIVKIGHRREVYRDLK